MKVAIVILNWNGKKMLQSYLSSVIKYSSDGAAEVVVADNASTDDSMEYVRTTYPNVWTIMLDKNYGFADGYNRALRQIDAEYYLLINSDVEVTQHWLDPLVSFMDAHSECAACQPKILSMFNRDMFEYAGAAGGFIDKYGYPFCRGRIFNKVEIDTGQYNNITEILWATGACMLVRSSDFWNAGGFDPRFFAHNEEIDLCWRMRIMGRKIYCVPASTVYHVGGGTLPKSNPMKTYLNFRNNLTMLYKNTENSDLSKVMFMRFLLDYVAAFKMLIVDHNFGEFKAVLKARRDFHKWLPEFKNDRLNIQKKRRVKVIAGLYKKSLLWQFYFRGIHKFCDLQLIKNFCPNSIK